MSRIVPFDEKEVCDECGAVGAFDFMGDFLCGSCASVAIDEQEKHDELKKQDAKLYDFASAVSMQSIAKNYPNEE
tara:strand:- start:258 stop:482 length:225 start_codon:yes stop_codon:yes gene_type:complete